MKNALTFAVSLAAISVAAPQIAHADTQPFTGPNVGVSEGYVVQNEVSYDNPGTPHQELTGAMLGFTAGYDVGLSDHVTGGLQLNVHGGNLSTVVADGNSIREPGAQKALATLMARLGYTPSQNVLLYVGAGLALGQFTQGEICTQGQQFGFCGETRGHAPFNLSDTHLQQGWAAAVGGEYRFAPRWTFGAEVDYMNFGADTFRLSPDHSGNALPDSVAHHEPLMLLLTLRHRFGQH